VLSLDNMLEPIPGALPAGQDLRYDRVFDQIREARTEDDATLPSGDWQRQTKRADYPLVVSLATEAIKTRSKDLWLTVWLGEARIKQDGAEALPATLDLLLQMQEQFWDTLHPEIEGGDLVMRAAPLQWGADRYATLIYESPVLQGSTNYQQYKLARAMGSETEAANNDSVRAARLTAIGKGHATPEQVDEALDATEREFYIDADRWFTAARASLERLYLFCEAKYRDDGPSFVKLRTALEEVHNLLGSLLRTKLERDPESPPQAQPQALEYISELSNQAVIEVAESQPKSDSPVLVEPPIMQESALPEVAKLSIKEPPAAWDQTIEQIRRCALFLARERPASPIAYLVLCSLRSETLQAVDAVSIGSYLTPPSTETRIMLKSLSRDGAWQELQHACLDTLASPFGPEWFDLHRYLWSASMQLGHERLAKAVVRSCRSMLHGDTSPLHQHFADDTPVAREETLEWIEREVRNTEASVGAEAPLPQLDAVPTVSESVMIFVEDDATATPDALEVAKRIAAEGDIHGAAELLFRDAAANPSSRRGFRRRLQIARLCLTFNKRPVAARMLRQLLREADDRQLESWEGSDFVAEVLSLLLGSVVDTETTDDRDVLFSRLCQLDPAAALRYGTQVQMGEAGTW
jgi:type VI secretion system protein ImpA